VGSTGSPEAARGTQRPPAELTVRPANQGDAVPLGFFFDAVLRKDYFLRRGQLADMLASPYHQVLVAEIDGILVGVAVTTRGTRLVNALVHPAYRGLGIGRALIQQSGATEVRAKTDMSSGDPRGFYAALGFRPVGRAEGKGNIEVMRLRGKRISATSKAGCVPKVG
jgi:ribosomal protein S18 acetylase RimI-like enzyme